MASHVAKLHSLVSTAQRARDQQESYFSAREQRTAETLQRFADDWAQTRGEAPNDVASRMGNAFFYLQRFNPINVENLRKADDLLTGGDSTIRTAEREIPRIQILPAEVAELGLDEIVDALQLHDPVQAGLRAAMMTEYANPFSNANCRLAYLLAGTPLYALGLPIPRLNANELHGQMDKASNEWGRNNGGRSLINPVGPEETALYNLVLNSVDSELKAIQSKDDISGLTFAFKDIAIRNARAQIPAGVQVLGTRAQDGISYISVASVDNPQGLLDALNNRFPGNPVQLVK